MGFEPAGLNRVIQFVNECPVFHAHLLAMSEFLHVVSFRLWKCVLCFTFFSVYKMENLSLSPVSQNNVLRPNGLDDV